MTGCTLTSDTDDKDKSRDALYCIGACISYRDEKVDHSKDVDIRVVDPNAPGMHEDAGN